MKHLIFDFDGTLVDSLDLVINLYNDLARKYGFKKIASQDVYKLTSLPLQKSSIALGVPIFLIPFFLMSIKNRYKYFLHMLKTKPGIEKTLFNLKSAGFSMGILSSNTPDTIHHYLRKNDLALFENIYPSKLLGKHTALNLYAKNLRLKKTELLYIGDEVRDIIASKKAGIKVVAVTWGFEPEALLREANPDYVIRHPDELLKILQDDFTTG